MTEFMGLIWGKYDAKKEGFQPGGASLHSIMTPHGPDADTFLKASAAPETPVHFDGGLAFMFETTLMLKVTPWALSAEHRDLAYQKCWQQLPRVFDPAVRDMKSLTIKPHSATLGGGHAGEVTDESIGGGSGVSVVSTSLEGTAGGEGVHKRRREYGPVSAGSEL